MNYRVSTPKSNPKFEVYICKEFIDSISDSGWEMKIADFFIQMNTPSHKLAKHMR